MLVLEEYDPLALGRYEAMAAAAAEHLLRRPRESDATPTSILLPFEIVVRESTGRPAGVEGPTS